ncbi:MAG: hypothetical protein JWM00_420 [Candidatus Saccharibacteria bacterium]|nr:hypothetical protein [Candidatus Saccharibacteria bacterium]
MNPSSTATIHELILPETRPLAPAEHKHYKNTLYIVWGIFANIDLSEDIAYF